MEWTNQQQLPAGNEQEFMCNRDDCSECFVLFLSFLVIASSCSVFSYDVLLHLVFIECIALIHQTLAQRSCEWCGMEIWTYFAGEEVAKPRKKQSLILHVEELSHSQICWKFFTILAHDIVSALNNDSIFQSDSSCLVRFFFIILSSNAISMEAQDPIEYIILFNNNYDLRYQDMQATSSLFYPIWCGYEFT